MQPNPSGENRAIRRQSLYFLIYVAIFGTIWGIGTSLLIGTLPSEPLTRSIIATWFEVTILLLTKMIVRHPFSVTFAITIAATISIFTFSFGPPNPWKPLFLFAGLAFDAGTFFRSKGLRLWNIFLGLLIYVPTILGIFLLIIYLIDPGITGAVLALLPMVALIYIVEGLIIGTVLWRFLRPERAPARVVEIWRQLGVA